MEISSLINNALFEKLLSHVSAEKRERVLRFRFDIDKKLSLYSEIILRNILCEKLSRENQGLVFLLEEYGKPYLEGNPVFFNLSHTRSAIAIAVSDMPVGIDVERVDTCPSQVANQFFTFKERAYIFSAPEKQDERFYQIWTKKEAYIKYLGKGISEPLSSFDVFLQTHIPTIKTNTIQNYVISICTESRIEPVPITVLFETDMAMFKPNSRP